MSVRFPVCTASEVAAVLRKHRFELAGQKGSHQKWRHPDGRMVIVPVHGSKTIPVGTLKSIVAGAKLAPGDFR
jgi:predicted RNA binding protein YcfA (HicA-like mRNA interferase family)